MPYVDLNTIHKFLVDSPVCSISQATSQTVADSTLVVLGTTSLENFDNDAMHSDASNRSRITIQTAGRYLFLASVVTDAFAGAASSFYRISFRIDGTTAIGGTQIKNASGATQVARFAAVRSLVLSVGQYVELTTFHNLGGSLEVTLEELVAQFMTR